MLFAVVGVLLFILGWIVGWVGPKVGTTLAILISVLWFVVVVNINSGGELSSAESSDLSVGMLIGMFAFLIGSNTAERASARRKRRRAAPKVD